MATERGQVLVLQHEPTVGPGNLGAWLDARAIPWRLAEARAGDFPKGDWQAVVVLGSEASAYDESLDWLREEKRFLQPLVDRGVPVLGLCFGGQLLALLTGGTVRRAERTIRGWTEVEADDGLLEGRWLSWHGDEILPAPGAVVIARSATCVEAFQIGPHLGLQFHPEATSSIVECWTEQDFGMPGREREAERVRADTDAHLPGASYAARGIYERFFTGALGSRLSSEGLQS